MLRDTKQYVEWMAWVKYIDLNTEQYLNSKTNNAYGTLARKFHLRQKTSKNHNFALRQTAIYTAVRATVHQIIPIRCYARAQIQLLRLFT